MSAPPYPYMKSSPAVPSKVLSELPSSQIKKEKFLFIPIIIDEDINNLIIFSNNPIYDNWNKDVKTYELINYLLPSEDLEDYNLIKVNLDNLETYDFSEITKKYFLDNYIISLIFRSKSEIRVLNKIYNINSQLLLKYGDLEN